MESTHQQHPTGGPSAEEEKRTLPATVATGNGAVPAPIDADIDFGDEAGAGLEGTRLEEQVTPFLRMAQGLSPELNPGKGEYIKGLALGDIFNTATGAHYNGKEGVEFVACWKDYHYGCWIPRDLGTGYRGALTPDDPLVQQTLARMRAKYGSSARFKLPRYKKETGWSDPPPRTRDTNEEIELVETGQLYVLYAPGQLEGGNWQRAILSCTSTALQAYTNLVSGQLNQLWPQRGGGMKPAPIYAYRYRLTTFLDSRGTNEFFNWKMDLAVPRDYRASLYATRNPDLYAAALDFYKQALAGAVKIADPGAGSPAKASRSKMTAYLLVYGANPSDRFAVHRYETRREAWAAGTTALVPRVPPEGRAGGHAYVIENAEDVTFGPDLLRAVLVRLGVTASGSRREDVDLLLRTLAGGEPRPGRRPLYGPDQVILVRPADAIRKPLRPGRKNHELYQKLCQLAPLTTRRAREIGVSSEYLEDFVHRGLITIE